MTKNKKLFFLFIFCILLFILIFQLVKIYAVFHTETIGNVRMQNGAWNIIVNGTDITSGTDVKFVIDTIKTSENLHVKPGNLAPGLSSNFEIVINPENTDVSVKYDVILSQENFDNSNIKIKSIEQVGAGDPLIQTGENQYTGIIPLEDIKNGMFHKIKVEIEWIEDEENNTEDINMNTNLKIPIVVHAIQYLGEEIIPFNTEK